MWYGVPGWPGGPTGYPVPQQRPPTADERLLARVRHPAFDPEAADRLVEELTCRELRRLWSGTGAQLDHALPDRTRLHVVRLREAVLRRLEADHPAAAARILRGRRRRFRTLT